MAFILKEPNGDFIRIKLTDAGRRQLSLGRLTFTKAGFSDREINYSIAGSNEFSYNITYLMNVNNPSKRNIFMDIELVILYKKNHYRNRGIHFFF